MAKRPRRSWLLVLTAEDRKVAKAAEGNADVLILDLSDSVTPDASCAQAFVTAVRKASWRLVAEAVRQSRWPLKLMQTWQRTRS